MAARLLTVIHIHECSIILLAFREVTFMVVFKIKAAADKKSFYF